MPIPTLTRRAAVLGGAASAPAPLPVFQAAGAGKTWSAAASTGNIPVPAGVADGDLLLAFLAVGSQPAITPPAGWTQEQQQNAGVRRMWAFSRIASSEPANYAWSFDASPNGEGVIIAIRPAAASGAVEDRNGVDNPSSTSAPAPTLTALGVNRLLVCAWSCGSTHTISAPASMTSRFSAGNGSWLQVATEIVAVAGATGPRTASLDTAGTSGGVSLLVKGT